MEMILTNYFTNRSRIRWITKFVDGKDFVNREYHEKLKAEGASKMLKPFE